MGKSIFKPKIFWVLILSVVALVIVIGLKACFASYSGEDSWVYISHNSTEDELKRSICNALGSNDGKKVVSFYKMLGGDPKKSAGAYKISNGELLIKIARNIKLGRQTPVKVVWNNLRSFDQLAQRIDECLEIDSLAFTESSRRILNQRGVSDAEMIGYFLPNSYEFYWTASADDVVNKLLSAYDEFWNDERIKKASDLNLTPIEVATIASIVEEETAKSDEKPVVARLYLNRLQKGMKLQADPTIRFALNDFNIKRVTGKDLTVVSPYNTYMYQGLPPGPIRNVEASTIDMVLNAPKHNYIFMCAKEDFSGYHNFATTYAEHQINAKRYQSELNKRAVFH